MSETSEETLAGLLRMLSPAPRGWVEAAQELPAARLAIDEIAERARADADFRRAVIADLESALAAEGYEPRQRLVDALRARLVEE